MKDILERDKNGEPVSVDDPEYPKIRVAIMNYKLYMEANGKRSVSYLSASCLQNLKQINRSLICWEETGNLFV